MSTKVKRLGRVNVILKMELNALARAFYSMCGYHVAEGYDFSKAVHPHEKLCWEQAKVSFEILVLNRQ